MLFRSFLSRVLHVRTSACYTHPIWESFSQHLAPASQYSMVDPVNQVHKDSGVVFELTVPSEFIFSATPFSPCIEAEVLVPKGIKGIGVLHEISKEEFQKMDDYIQGQSAKAQHPELCPIEYILSSEQAKERLGLTSSPQDMYFFFEV